MYVCNVVKLVHWFVLVWLDSVGFLFCHELLSFALLFVLLLLLLLLLLFHFCHNQVM